MTLITLLSDARSHPHVFRWNGGVPRAQIDRWLADVHWNLPTDLLELWRELGGGELFESETIFQPSLDGEDDIDDENEQLVVLGLPLDVFAFHRGICVSAIDQMSGQIVALDTESFTEEGRFETLEEWYRRLIRVEFGERYGLQPLK